jgi:hypothetical protein
MITVTMVIVEEATIAISLLTAETVSVGMSTNGVGSGSVRHVISGIARSGVKTGDAMISAAIAIGLA